MRKSIKSIKLFGGEMLSNPGPVGSAVPSSRALARRIAGFLPPQPEGFVIELGAGTGSVTAALLEHGIAPERIIPIELSPKMALHLEERFPTLKILDGDATKLSQLLAERAPHCRGRISHIVSSLPLRSLPPKAVASIAHEIEQLLLPGGTFIQFTYHLIGRRFRPLAAFERHASSVVWFNIPPARVDVFKVRKGRGPMTDDQ